MKIHIGRHRLVTCMGWLIPAIFATACAGAPSNARATTASSAVRREALLLDPSNAEWTKPAPPISHLRFETTKGVFVLELVRAQGPIGADRLYNLARLGYYDDTRFHRVNKEYIAQFGLHGDPAVNAVWKDQYLADDAPHSDNKRGTFAFAMKGTLPNTRNRQIYINLKDNTRSDAEPFTMLGTVVEGMAVVDSLYSGYGENSGSGVRQGKQGPLEAGGNAVHGQGVSAARPHQARHGDHRYPPLTAPACHPYESA